VLAGGASLVVLLVTARKAAASRRPGTLSDAFVRTEIEPSRQRLEPVPAPAEVPEIMPRVEPLPGIDPRDVEAAARMIASENPKGSRRLHIEQVWTQILSMQRAQSLYDRITAGSRWGPQVESRVPWTRPARGYYGSGQPGAARAG
jgi:hypothetical protein